MDPIESINFKKDTTLAILLAAQKRECEIFYMLQSDLYADQGSPRASMTVSYTHLTLPTKA